MLPSLLDFLNLQDYLNISKWLKIENNSRNLDLLTDNSHTGK